MITDQQARIACDRNPFCLPHFVWYSGTETDYDIVEASLKDAGWIVDNGEHICPACVPEWEAERRAEQSEYEADAAHESRLMDQDNARDINRMSRRVG